MADFGDLINVRQDGDEKRLDLSETRLFFKDADGFRSFVSRRVADIITSLTPGNVVLDACAGIGGNTIAYAFGGKKVISVEIDENRFKLLKENVRTALKVGEFDVTLIQGDFLEVVKKPTPLPLDSIYLDLPWGGSPSRVQSFKFKDMPVDALLFVKAALARSSTVILKLPHNFDLSELQQFNVTVENHRIDEGFNDGRPNVLLAVLHGERRPPRVDDLLR